MLFPASHRLPIAIGTSQRKGSLLPIEICVVILNLGFGIFNNNLQWAIKIQKPCVE
jgi:hypothetical protein